VPFFPASFVAFFSAFQLLAIFVFFLAILRIAPVQSTQGLTTQPLEAGSFRRDKRLQNSVRELYPFGRHFALN
jgi:hypothetical protein